MASKTTRDGALVRGWRYFLIFLGVSFNKLKALHELEPEDQTAVEEWRNKIREIATRLAEGEMLKTAAGRVEWPDGVRFFQCDREGHVLARIGSLPSTPIRERNMHRFPIAGKEHVEKVLKVTFDPDSEIRALEFGAPLVSRGQILGSLGVEVPYPVLRQVPKQKT